MQCIIKKQKLFELNLLKNIKSRNGQDNDDYRSLSPMMHGGKKILTQKSTKSNQRKYSY